MASVASSCSRVRLTSTGIGGGRRRGPLGSGMLCPIASTFGSPSRPSRFAGSPFALRIARLVSRIAVRDSDGAAIATRWPRPASSAETRPTNSLISWRAPHGRGQTWTIESFSPDTR
jgi:hypothetical protein